MSKNDPKEARLARLALFAKADSEALDHLAAAADEVTVAEGRRLISQGHRHNELYILESGSAEVQVDGKKVADIPAGEFIGELAFFTNTAASADVVTTSETTLLVIPYNRFDQILDDNPALVRAIAAELADRLVETDAKLHTANG